MATAKQIIEPEDCTEWMYILGLIFADGHVHNNSRIHKITIHGKEAEILCQWIYDTKTNFKLDRKYGKYISYMMRYETC